MPSDDLKRICAKEALKYIENNTIIGLGGGRTIAYLIEYLSEKVKDGFNIKIVTPSTKTKLLCIKSDLEVLHTSSVSEVSVAFDGCDQVDEKLNALKSGGGIHTKEKLIASMAKEYILLVDETKLVKLLDFKYPVVLEILEDALSYVESMVRNLGGNPVARTSSRKDGFVISDNGNLLIDVKFNTVRDCYELESSLRNIPGVISTSLFNNIVTKVLVTSENGIRVIKKYHNWGTVK